MQCDELKLQKRFTTSNTVLTLIWKLIYLEVSFRWASSRNFIQIQSNKDYRRFITLQIILSIMRDSGQIIGGIHCFSKGPLTLKGLNVNGPYLKTLSITSIIYLQTYQKPKNKSTTPNITYHKLWSYAMKETITLRNISNKLQAQLFMPENIRCHNNRSPTIKPVV